MSRFHGPQPGYKSDRPFANQKKGPKGVMKLFRQLKREEAEKRNANTPAEKRRSSRRKANESARRQDS